MLTSDSSPLHIQVLEHLLKGKLSSVKMKVWWVWVDYFSVPFMEWHDGRKEGRRDCYRIIICPRQGLSLATPLTDTHSPLHPSSSRLNAVTPLTLLFFVRTQAGEAGSGRNTVGEGTKRTTRGKKYRCSIRGRVHVLAWSLIYLVHLTHCLLHIK